MKTLLNVGVLLASVGVTIGGAMQAMEGFKTKNYKKASYAAALMMVGVYAAKESIDKLQNEA
jgi:hypothetical protein